jgi:hypothetical protein
LVPKEVPLVLCQHQCIMPMKIHVQLDLNPRPQPPPTHCGHSAHNSSCCSIAQSCLVAQNAE